MPNPDTTFNFQYLFKENYYATKELERYDILNSFLKPDDLAIKIWDDIIFMRIKTLDWIYNIIYHYNHNFQIVPIELYSYIFECFIIKHEFEISHINFYAILTLNYLMKLSTKDIIKWLGDDIFIESLDTEIVYFEKFYERYVPDINKLKVEYLIKFLKHKNIPCKTNDNFLLYEKIGYGTYGVVYNCEDGAAKLLCKHISEIYNSNYLNEIVISFYLSKIDKDKIIDYKYVLISNYQIFIVMERAETTFHHMLLRNKDEIDIDDIVKKSLTEISRILILLKVHNISHNDLHTKNILIVNNKLKLADFGNSSFYNKNFEYYSKKDIRYLLSYLSYSYKLESLTLSSLYKWFFPDLRNNDPRNFFERNNMWIISINNTINNRANAYSMLEFLIGTS